MSGPVVNPYAPISGILGVDNLVTYEVVVGGAERKLILPADPTRLYAVLFFALSSPLVTPFSDNAVYNIDSTLCAPGRSLLLHHASYPGLVQRDWYGIWSAPGSVMVIDVSSGGQ